MKFILKYNIYTSNKSRNSYHQNIYTTTSGMDIIKAKNIKFSCTTT